MRVSIIKKKFISSLLILSLCVSVFSINLVADSTNGLVDFVTRCYAIALGRTPDQEGLDSWVNQLESGSACGVSVAYGFVYSSEFQNAGYDNPTYVEKMYNMLLGRASDAEGKASWVELLDNGSSKEDIFTGFANSQEFYNLCSSYGVFSGYYISGSSMDRNAAINGFVDRLYTICLDRHGDIGGQSGWVSQLANAQVDGASTAYGFIFSAEYANKNTSNEEYITMLYSTFFGRQPDSAGYNGWVNKLDLGTVSRESVFNGFANSTEFTNICDKYGISRGTAAYDDKTFTPNASVTPTSTPEITTTSVPSNTPIVTTNTPTAEPTASVTIKEQVLVNQDGIKVTAKRFVSDPIWGDGIEVLIENNSDIDISVSLDQMIINDYMVGNLFAKKVAAGKKVTDTIDILESYLDKANITNIGKIEFYFNAFDANYDDYIFKDVYSEIHTSDYSKLVEESITGTTVYDANGIKVIPLSYDENASMGPTVYLYCENASDKNILIYVEDLSANDCMINGINSVKVYGKKKAILEISVYPSQMEEQGIDKVKELEFKFNIFDTTTYETIDQTEVIKLIVG